MVFELNLNKLTARLLIVVISLALCALLVLLVVYRFTVGTLADGRVPVTRDMLVNPVKWFPNSARLNARLADAELVESDLDLSSASLHARRAVSLSPYDFRFRVIQAKVEIARGDLQAAEQALKAARALAPANKDVRYKLGNILVREGKLAESIEEFRLAIAGDSPLLPATLDLVWRASRANFDAVDRVTGDDPKSKLALALFLLNQSQISRATEVFRRIPPAVRIEFQESSSLISGLVAESRFDTARELWLSIAGDSGNSQNAIWNGGFESDIYKNFAQFNWQLATSDYATVNIEAGAARTGARALRVDFAGRDSTVLDGEIKQLVLVRAGARYKLSCYARTKGLEAEEGPRVVVTSFSGQDLIAASAPVATGTTDWQMVSLEFTAPKSSAATVPLYVSIKRKPKNDIYEEPVRGTVWFDDFIIEER